MISLVNEGAQLLEVLPAPEFDQENLPAINIPLKELTRDGGRAAASDVRWIVLNACSV